MGNIVDSMFGPAPYEVRQFRNDSLNRAADQYAGQDPFAQANGQIFRAGGMLAGSAAPSMGLVDPMMQQAQQEQSIQGQIDHSTAQGLMQGAQLFGQAGNPRMAAAYVQAAQVRKAADAKESPYAKIDPKDYTPESLAAFSQTGNPAVLKARDKPQYENSTTLEKLIAYRDSLPAGSPNLVAVNNAIRKESETAKQITPTVVVNKTNQYNLSDIQQEALDKAITEGRLNPDRINSRSAMILANQFIRNPALDMVGTAARATLQKNGTFVQKQELVQAIPEILGNMVEAGKKIGFNDNRTVGKMQAFVKGEFNDPDYVQYMAQRNDALLTIAGTMRAAGMSDQAHRAEIEAANPTMSPAALDAWLHGQMKSLEPRLKIANKYLSGPTSGTQTNGPVPVADYNSKYGLTPKGAQ